jgi:hypothetical protein
LCRDVARVLREHGVGGRERALAVAARELHGSETQPRGFFGCAPLLQASTSA